MPFANRPTLGICLGSQLLARAVGATVAFSGHTEIGYSPLQLTPAGKASPLRHLDNVPVLHWHNDRFEIPTGADHLASTTVCTNQAFAKGRNLLGLQFHLEMPASTIERWLIGHATALITAGIDPHALRQDAADVDKALTPAAQAVIREWIASLHDAQPKPE